MKKRIPQCVCVIVMSFLAAVLAACGAGTAVPALDGPLLQEYQQAKLDYWNGAYDKAEAGLRRVADKRADFFQARFMLGKTLFSEGRIAEAEALFRELCGQYPAFHEAEIWAARSELASGKTDEARARLARLLAFDSSDPRLLALYAKASAAKKDAAAAIQYYKLSAQYEDELALNHYELARYYYQFGMRDKALLEIDKCLLLLANESALRDSVLALKNNILQRNGVQK
jgi:tetratricopeptide (TPR) repeat protein